MGIMKFMEDNEQMYIERQYDHGADLIGLGGDRKIRRPKEEVGKQKWRDPGGKTIRMI